jgi:hypothetical protein
MPTTRAPRTVAGRARRGRPPPRNARASKTLSDRSWPFVAIQIRGPTSLTFGELLLTTHIEARLQRPHRLRHGWPVGVMQVNLDLAEASSLQPLNVAQMAAARRGSPSVSSFVTVTS